MRPAIAIPLSSPVAALLFSSAALVAPPRADAQPLTPAERAVLDAIPSETTRSPDESYPASNEWRHDLFASAISDLGGVFVGVGTDQCYTLAAVQDASLVVIADYDPAVARVHRMYGALVRSSDDPAAFVSRFDEANEEATAALLERELAADPDAPAIVRTFRRNRGRFAGYLAHVRILERDGRPTSWLSDPALYARIRRLFTTDRVIARTADVTGTTTLRAIGAAARRLRIPVRVLYLSNAEVFFRYTPAFLENLQALALDERAVVLRTFRHARAPYPEDDTWHYMIHPGRDLVARIEAGYFRSTWIVMDALRSGLGASGVTTVTPATPRLFGGHAPGRAADRAR
jgi:hypothetical protein